ncbi:uncharacterized protein CC84DRAFT_415587 [Paraphaeosphaeria sporulosa]|uniref:Uncharacterized protein n=1 Tax=Paraphaeosphaeria sporulosa TaxID=1460663 RepID=A0A177BX19_9PLEO|nr:uncharacterized protein CC84DRAFT_415587 [Paraphaeosphaeria sporulosa]OAF99057.1 hypothetical protein CC84DRAFT_415587 [Paraphaeosphaeria sporulosa]
MKIVFHQCRRVPTLWLHGILSIGCNIAAWSHDASLCTQDKISQRRRSECSCACCISDGIGFVIRDR